MILKSEPKIDVGILLKKRIRFELKGSFQCNNKAIPEGNFEASIQENVITTPFSIGPEIHIISINSDSTFILKKVCIGLDFHWEQSEDQEFEGALNLQIEEGKIRAVNTIQIEAYLRSVISSEMSAMNDFNLLKVHAIVSRSWLLAQLQNKKLKKLTILSTENKNTDELIKWYDKEDHSGFDVCADDHCQRYQGITKIVSKNAAKAIEATRGLVLSHNNEVCDARFSKCCGGISEAFEKVWQDEAISYLTPVRDYNSDLLPYNDEFILSNPDSFCNTNDSEILNQILLDFDQKTTDFYRWRVEYSQAELSTLLNNKSRIDFGTIYDLVPIERGQSGRIIKLKIKGSKRTIVVGKELEIRKWLSESHLYSSAFVVEKEFENGTEIPSAFVLHGAGWGHGVGMCQIGAAVMSQKGYAVNDILSHYFTNAKVTSIYK
jgi:stage II sporulation protein D